jgi:hypothetical protein
VERTALLRLEGDTTETVLIEIGTDDLTFAARLVGLAQQFQ